MRQGILLIDKPADWTSFDAVNYIRGQIAREEGVKPKSIKVGHAGTLDPFATGLLVILVGKKYTRRAVEFSKLDKTYEVTMRLGSNSSTGDPEGEITPVNGNKPSLEAVKEAAAKFVGEIEQVPPAYSAIKIDGQRAYKLARAGKEVIIEPRKVTIHKLEITGYEYPDVNLMTDVSSGTYIRTLVEDIGAMLGTGAYTVALMRTQIGQFSLGSSVQVKHITPEDIQEL